MSHRAPAAPAASPPAHAAPPALGWRSAARRLWPLLLACMLLQGGVGWLLARSYLTANNTLLANGRWVSSKSQLERGLLGAYAYLTGPQALAGGRLNLDAWHGFNEVLFHEPIAAPATLEADVEIGRGSYVVVVFDRPPGGGPYSALRLSNRRGVPSLFATVSAEGELLERHPLREVRLEPERTYRLRVEQMADRVRFALDGAAIGEFAQRPLARQLVGFRGGRRAAAVDDVELRAGAGDGLVFRETFDSPPRFAWLTPVLVVAMAALGLGLFPLVHRRHPGGGLHLGLAYAMVNSTLLVLGVALLVYVGQRVRWYPGLTDALREEEEYFKKGEASRVVAELQTQLAALPEGGARTTRILFVGSSQTWGAGAPRAADAFVPRFEAMLDAAAPGRDFAAFNGGVSATRARDQVALLREHWLATEPDWVVINFGSNDKAGGKDFPAAMRTLVELARGAGARVALVKEANSSEVGGRGLANRHAEIEALAAELGLPVVDLHGHLLEREDTGFVWWDQVHLTAYGHRLAAEKLFADLGPLLLAESIGPAATAPEPPAAD